LIGSPGCFGRVWKRTALAAGVWERERARNDPGFDQRFSATPGLDSFEGRWQLARTPRDWEDDLKVVYRRRD
jgi:hypothetical protein